MRAKRKRKGDPGAAMAYMRRLHGGPADPAPVDDLADLAEREQTTDPMKKENNNKRQDKALGGVSGRFSGVL